MNTLAHAGPGPWILLFPLVWAAVIFGLVTVARRARGFGRFAARGATPGPTTARPSPSSATGSPPERSTRTSTGAG